MKSSTSVIVQNLNELKIEKLERLLRALSSPRPKFISGTRLIPGMARSLIMLKTERHRPLPDRAIHLMAALTRDAKKLRQEMRGSIPAGWTTVVEILITLEKSTRELQARISADKKLRSNPRKRAPRKSEPTAIAEQSAKFYELITLKKPTRVVLDGKASGPFVEFLERVFEILEVKASAEHQARLAIQSMERSAQEKR